MVKQISFVSLFLLGSIAVHAEKKPVDPLSSAEALRDYILNSDAEEDRVFYGSEQLSRSDQRVYYRIEYPELKVFPGIILENGKIAPAIIDRGRRTPACLDQQYRRHPAVWNSEAGQLECQLSQVDMLDFDANADDQEKQISATQITTAPHIAEMDAALGPGRFQKGSPQQERKDANAVNASGPGSVVAQMAEGGLGEGPGRFTKGSAAKSEVEERVERAFNGARRAAREDKRYTSSSSRGHQAAYTKPRDPNMYVPVTSASNIPVAVTIQEKEGADDFGVPRGTWARVTLTESVNSADKSEAELTLLDNLIGDYQTLPKGTKLFARKRFNNGTEKLDLEINMALTPSNEEINGISARVYDTAKREGLNGIVKRLRKEEIKALLSKSTVSALGSVLPQANGVVDGVVEDISTGMINQESQYLKGIPKATIQVSPQEAWIKISQSF